MSAINNFTVSGRLVRDASVSTTSSGSVVLRMTIAQNKYLRNKDGTFTEKTYFLPISSFGISAERISRMSLTKGTLVVVTGDISTSESTDDSGKRTTTVYLNAGAVESLAPRKQQGSGTNQEEGTEEQNDTIDDDDAPF